MILLTFCCCVGCYGCLVDYVRFEGFSFKRAFVFSSAVTLLVRLLCWGITWYNPPSNSSVKTNLGRKFLNIVDKCFPKNHPLHKIFNRHTLKLSYSCMPNMKSIIASHNKTLLSDYTPPQHSNLQVNLTSNVTAERKTNAHLKENALK